MPLLAIGELYERHCLEEKNWYRMNKSRLETERLALIEFFESNLKFLLDDLGYTRSLEMEFDEYVGAKFYFLRYTNYHRQRQMEIILHRNSDYRLWLIKRMKGSAIPDYYDNVNIIDIPGLDLLTHPTTYDSMQHAVFSEEKKRQYVLKMIELIKRHWLGVLEGSQWIDRAQIDKVSFNKWGVKSGFHRDELLEKIKTEFKFLENYGYKLIEDTNLLPLYKQSCTCEIIYSNPDTNENYRILNDYRDYGFRIEYFTSEGQIGEMINYVLTEDQDKEWEFVTRMANWLENRIRNT